MALSDIDRRLLQRCLAGEAHSWDEFVDRFIGLVVHVVDHTASVRGFALTREDREDLISEVFLAIVRNDLGVLRQFRGASSLATYLTVIARRVVVRQIRDWQKSRTLERARRSADRGSSPPPGNSEPPLNEPGPEQRISDREELDRLLSRLDGDEAEVVRLYHLQGLSYREISNRVGMPENTVGPTLSRARVKMRQASADSTLT